MSDTKPRDLTPDERALIDSPAVRGGDSVPLRIPPGTNVAVELLNASSTQATAVSPSAGPDETPG